jgi:hypothetical protein
MLEIQLNYTLQRPTTICIAISRSRAYAHVPSLSVVGARVASMFTLLNVLYVDIHARGVGIVLHERI